MTIHAEPNASSPPPRILIVDDEADIIHLLETVLRLAGYTHVCSTSDSRQAVSLFEEIQPDLILLDLTMPYFSGLEVLEQLRPLISTETFLPIIVLTGHSDHQTKQKALLAGAHDFLTKPCEPAEVLQRIANLWQIRALQLHLQQQNQLLEAQVQEATQRRQEAQEAFQALSASEERYRRIVETANEGIWMVDATFHTTYANKHWCDMLGYSSHAMSGRSVFDFVFEVDQELLQERINKRLARRLEGHRERFDFRWRRQDGSSLHTLCSTTPVFDSHGQLSGIFGMFTDITERHEAEQTAAALYQQLREFAGNQQESIEAERGRIAREIHDELGQMLSVAKMSLFELGDWFEEECAPNTARPASEPSEAASEVFHEKLGEISHLMDQGIDSVRRIARELRPSVLDDLGLVAALEWQAQQFQQRTAISCTLMTDFCSCFEEEQLKPGIATALFRIFQEALTNVLRHAEANSIEVQLHSGDGWVRLRVQDNGCGLIDSQPASSGGLGLVGMRERAHLLGGTVDICGIAGEGTTITVTIPYDANPSDR